jgi:hypothetical protein
MESVAYGGAPCFVLLAECYQDDQNKEDIRWIGMYRRNAYKVLVGKRLGKIPVRKPARRCENNIKIRCKDLEWDGCALDSSGSGQRSVTCCCEHGHETSDSIKSGKSWVTERLLASSWIASCCVVLYQLCVLSVATQHSKVCSHQLCTMSLLISMVSCYMFRLMVYITGYSQTIELLSV